MWAERHERRILRLGVPLSPEEFADAVLMGVSHPEKVRLLEVKGIPVLNGFFITGLSRLVPQISPHTVGLSLRYGIYIHSRCKRNRMLVAHECVHTAQYERYGSTSGFLQAYLGQCLISGYPAAALEREAIELSAALAPSHL
jgi:hypothetical protein